MKVQGVGLKFKDGICVKLCLKLWFESDWYFCKITENKQSLPKVSSEAAVSRCSSK